MACGLGWTFETIGRLTLHDVNRIYEFWRETPPTNELIAWAEGWEKPLSFEEKIAAGSMSPADFMEHFKETKGVVKH